MKAVLGFSLLSPQMVLTLGFQLSTLRFSIVVFATHHLATILAFMFGSQQTSVAKCKLLSANC